jgi:hypothetical protein
MLRYLLVIFLSLTVTTGAASAAEECEAPEGIKDLSKIQPPKFLMPLPEPGKDLPEDCPFYQQAWQTFLFVTQKKGGKPEFLNYPTFEKVFSKKATPLFAEAQPGTLSLAPRGIQLPNAGKLSDPDLDMTDILQAAGSSALQKVLIDQNGNAVWYMIHVSQPFADFLKDYNLTDPAVLKKIPTDLEFRPGLVELKSAWQIVEGGTAPKNYITAPATVPVFKVDANGKIVRDGNKTRRVTVALLSLHVVTLIEGHPEFIWATFEHVTHKDSKNWVRDVAPAAIDNPDKTPVKVDIKLAKYALYPVTSEGPADPVAGANKGNKLSELILDVKTQKFSPITPVYRIFPASKCEESKEDDAVESLNRNVRDLFNKKPGDVRSNYQLVGAVWLNTPRVDFKAGQPFSDIQPQQPDKCDARQPALLGGENRLSNMALESFTQPTNRQPNCFSCHDTREGGMVNILPKSRLNVSHVLSKFFDLQQLKQ